MADAGALVGCLRSVQRLLDLGFDGFGHDGFARPVRAFVVRTEDVKNPAGNQDGLRPPGVSLWPYRVGLNRAVRSAWSAVGHVDGRVHLPVDLHFLLTPWGDNGDDELLVLGRAMLTLEANPILLGPRLDPSAAWAAAEALQIVCADAESDGVATLFDATDAPFKVSVPYIARVVRLETAAAQGGDDVGTVLTGVTATARGAP
ncbi:MAG TPA: Pvc16 family protein [Acidimicrobiales bacterium]